MRKATLFFIIITFLYSLSHSQTFTKIDTGIICNDGGTSYGSSWGDYDNDGLLDLFVCNSSPNLDGTGINFLYRNEGNVQFKKITNGFIVNELGDHGGACWGDYDNDGDEDLFIPKVNDSVLLCSNQGNGDFIKIINSNFSQSIENFWGSSWIDIDKDGYLDLFVVSGRGKNYLFRNEGNNTFQNIIKTTLTQNTTNSFSCSWVDFDNDGDLDLYTAENGPNNIFYINNGDGTFRQNITGCIVDERGRSLSSSWIDYDNDGYLDLFVANIFDELNFLYHNNRDGTFEKITSGDIVTDTGHNLSGGWGDFDNDGDLDLFVPNNPNGTNFYYRNEGDGNFSEITSGAIINDYGSNCSLCDVDNDGDLDILVTNEGIYISSKMNYLYINNGNNNNWIIIKLIGIVSNRTGIGTRIKAKANINGKNVWQMREISQQNISYGHNSLRAHFGFGDATVIDSLVIRWACGGVQVLTNVQTNQFLEITEPIAQHDITVLPILKFSNLETAFTRFTPEILIRNIGSNDEQNLLVSCKIDSYGVGKFSNSQSIDNLLSLQSKKVVFNNFTIPENGNYNVTYFVTQMDGDEKITNDTLRTRIESTSYLDDFESGLINWLLNYSGSGVSSLFAKYGKVSLIIKYDNDSESWVEFNHSFDLSQLEAAYLTFYTKYYIEQDNDFGYVEISSDSGNTWKHLGQDPYTGILANWRTDSLSLENYCGPGNNDVRLRFRIVSDATNTLPGWFIDDISIHSGKISTTVNLKNDRILINYALSDNYPNPFNNQTVISYCIPNIDYVKIIIYNILGKEIITIVDKKHQAGQYSVVWNGKDNKGNLVPTGVYFYKIETDNYFDCNKMLLLK